MMILISRNQMASVSLGIDIVEMLGPIPYVTFVLRPTPTQNRATGMTFALVNFH
jgi:hypothetical protein